MRHNLRMARVLILALTATTATTATTPPAYANVLSDADFDKLENARKGLDAVLDGILGQLNAMTGEANDRPFQCLSDIYDRGSAISEMLTPLESMYSVSQVMINPDDERFAVRAFNLQDRNLIKRIELTQSFIQKIEAHCAGYPIVTFRAEEQIKALQDVRAILDHLTDVITKSGIAGRR